MKLNNVLYQEYKDFFSSLDNTGFELEAALGYPEVIVIDKVRKNLSEEEETFLKIIREFLYSKTDQGANLKLSFEEELRILLVNLRGQNLNPENFRDKLSELKFVLMLVCLYFIGSNHEAGLFLSKFESRFKEVENPNLRAIVDFLQEQISYKERSISTKTKIHILNTYNPQSDLDSRLAAIIMDLNEYYYSNLEIICESSFNYQSLRHYLEDKRKEIEILFILGHGDSTANYFAFYKKQGIQVIPEFIYQQDLQSILSSCQIELELLSILTCAHDAFKDIKSTKRMIIPQIAGFEFSEMAVKTFLSRFNLDRDFYSAFEFAKISNYIRLKDDNPLCFVENHKPEGCLGFLSWLLRLRYASAKPY